MKLQLFCKTVLVELYKDIHINRQQTLLHGKTKKNFKFTYRRKRAVFESQLKVLSQLLGHRSIQMPNIGCCTYIRIHFTSHEIA